MRFVLQQQMKLAVRYEGYHIFIDRAVTGSARYIITGDRKHLLPLQRYRGIEIVSPAAFIALYYQ